MLKEVILEELTIKLGNRLSDKMVRYCRENGIEDIEDFAERCASNGFMRICFGSSPMDNRNREVNGIVDFSDEECKIDHAQSEDKPKGAVVRKRRKIEVIKK